MSLLYSVITTIALSIGLSGIPYSNIEKAFESNNSTAIVNLGKSWNDQSTFEWWQFYGETNYEQVYFMKHSYIRFNED